MADDDDGFKICGLCAQLPEESVAVTHDLAVFIADFLAGSLSRVPSKVCTECVQSAEDAKIFRNKCIKGTNKIRARNLPDSMILGGTTGKSVKSLSPGKQKGGGPAAAAAAASKFVTPSPPPLKKPRTSEVDNLITADVFEDKPRGGRGGPASRKSAGKPPPAAVETFYEEPLATSTGKRPGRRSATASVTSNGAGAGAGGGVPQAKIRIPNFEHSLAQEALTNGSVNYKDARKRKSINDSLNSLSSPSAVAARPKRISKADEALINGAQVDATSSFGRLRKPTAKRNYTGYSDDDDATSFGGGDNDEGFVPGGGRRSSSNKSPNKKLATPKSAGAAAKKGAAAAKKPGPKSRPGGGKAAAAANNSNNFYYVDDSHQPNGNGPTVEIENVDVDALPTSTSVDDPNENLEEAFPSVGPYQCEICQEVTDTKQQFVDHIRQFHRDVVDQEVLTTLEDDLRKAKKKAEKAKAGSPSKNAVAAAGTSKKRTTSAAAKPASAFKTQEPIEKRTCDRCGLVISQSKHMAKHQRTKSCIEKYNNAVYEKYKKNNATSSTTTTTTTVQNTTTVLYEGGRSTPMVEYNPMAFEESSAEDEEPMNILGDDEDPPTTGDTFDSAFYNPKKNAMKMFNEEQIVTEDSLSQAMLSADIPISGY